MLRTRLTKLGVARGLDFLAKRYFQVEFLNEDRLPTTSDTPVLMAMNHTAFFGLEVYLLGTRLLANNPEFDFRTLVWPGFIQGPAGNWFKQMGCDSVSVERGQHLLKSGKSVLIMPEGVGATDVRHRLNHFHTGYLHMISNQQIPVIPIAFTGIDEAIPWLVFHNRFLIEKLMKPVDPKFDFMLLPKLPIPRPTKVVFNIGEPIYFSKTALNSVEKVKAANEKVKATISSLMDEAETYRSQQINKSRLNRTYHRLLAGKVSIMQFPGS